MSVYEATQYHGKSLMEWAVLWFNTSNDAFYQTYGFNFNPHKHPGLYEQARERVYGATERNDGVRWFNG
jgi:hypothetical protein